MKQLAILLTVIALLAVPGNAAATQLAGADSGLLAGLHGWFIAVVDSATVLWGDLDGDDDKLGAGELPAGDDFRIGGMPDATSDDSFRIGGIPDHNDGNQFRIGGIPD